MQPIVTPEEMAAIDAAAPEPLEVLIERAGRAVASHALRMLGGGKKCAGKSVLVLYGPGNNGADGKYAGELLAKRGLAVELVSVKEAGKGKRAGVPDLLIDAAFGTGLSREYHVPRSFPLPSSLSFAGTHPVSRFPAKPGVPMVLAVDIPSGVDGLTGQVAGSAIPADRTITFGALKTGHLLYPGSVLAGDLFLDSIGLDVSGAGAWLVDEKWVADVLPSRPVDAHKWQSACWLIGGSAGMAGAVSLAAMGAFRSGSGYVRMSSFNSGGGASEGLGGNTGRGGAENTFPLEAVNVPLPAVGWSGEILKEADRFGALAIGPGLQENGLQKTSMQEIKQSGSAESSTAKSGGRLEFASEFAQLLASLEKPLLIDGGGLNILAGLGPEVLKNRKAPTILTPHDREFERLNGSPPSSFSAAGSEGSDRFSAVRELAAKYNAVVLLKGPTTLIAAPSPFSLPSVSHPSPTPTPHPAPAPTSAPSARRIFSSREQQGDADPRQKRKVQVLAVNTGDERLATAGTGDVLTGVITALMAQGVEAEAAAAAGAFIHGKAAFMGRSFGFMASDLAHLIPQAVEALRNHAHNPAPNPSPISNPAHGPSHSRED